MANPEWLTEIWRIREEEVYPRIFGPLPDQVIPMDPHNLIEILGNRPVDPRWLQFAVIEIPSTPDRPDWIYVTTAMSNPWNVKDESEFDPEGMSGMGLELMIRTPERANWAVNLLQRLMAYQIGVGYDLMKGRFFSYGDKMPLNGPISPDKPDTLLRGMVLSRPLDLQSQFELPSGKVDLLQILGITGKEYAYLLERGPDELIGLLYDQSAAPVTNPARQSIKLPKEYPLPPELARRF